MRFAHPPTPARGRAHTHTLELPVRCRSLYVAPLGRNTAKRIAHEFKTDGSVLSLLTLLDSPRRPRVLELVDAGQRARVEAECHALRIDLLPNEASTV